VGPPTVASRPLSASFSPWHKPPATQRITGKGFQKENVFPTFISFLFAISWHITQFKFKHQVCCLSYNVYNKCSARNLFRSIAIPAIPSKLPLKKNGTGKFGNNNDDKCLVSTYLSLITDQCSFKVVPWFFFCLEKNFRTLVSYFEN